MLTHKWKNLSIDFVTGLLISANRKDDSYKLILVIVNLVMKMIYYEQVKVMIDVLSLTEMIINVVVCNHRVPESIFTDRDLLFTSKFQTLLCYFPGIKKKLSTVFYSKRMVRYRGKMTQQNYTLKNSPNGSTITGQGYCQWLSWCTTMPKMQVPTTSHLNSIMASTPQSCSKRILISAPGPARLMNQLTSLKS